MSTVALLVGTRKGAFVLESTEDRSEWAVRGPLLPGWDVANMVLDDRGTPTLYAAVNHFVYGPTIHRSTDLGETFEQVESGPAVPEASDRELNQIWTITPGPADDRDCLYAGVDEAALFVTRDGGDTWSEVPGLANHPTREGWFPGKGGLCCHSICLDPTDRDRLWVAISAVGVFRTEDGGEHWTLCNDGLAVAAPDDEHDHLGSCVHRLVSDPTDPDRLYQQNHVGVYRTTDGADTWQRIDEGLPSSFGFPMELHPRDPETLYTVPLQSDEYRMAIDGDPAVYRSTDAGDSWERLADGMPTNAWVTVLRHALAVDDRNPAGIYVGTTGGSVYASADAGDTWRTLDVSLPRINSLSAAVVD